MDYRGAGGYFSNNRLHKIRKYPWSNQSKLPEGHNLVRPGQTNQGGHYLICFDSVLCPVQSWNKWWHHLKGSFSPPLPLTVQTNPLSLSLSYSCSRHRESSTFGRGSAAFQTTSSSLGLKMPSCLPGLSNIPKRPGFLWDSSHWGIFFFLHFKLPLPSLARSYAEQQ